MSGASLIDDAEHLDWQLVIEHAVPNTRSDTQFNALLRGKARATFNGRIHIHEGAVGTSADLTNRNLALDDGAEINTKPELEIYNDDVKCSHGATVGRLDDQALFYLMSRGIDADRARQLLCEAFLFERVAGAHSEAGQRVLAEGLARG